MTAEQYSVTTEQQAVTHGQPFRAAHPQGMTPPATFWDTADSLFALAWPHVAAAGLHMEHLRALAPIFTVQGFDAAVLPRTLRYLDWELEQLGLPENSDEARTGPAFGAAASATMASAPVLDAAHQLTQSYLRAMQRRGAWPRPHGYEEGDD